MYLIELFYGRSTDTIFYGRHDDKKTDLRRSVFLSSLAQNVTFCGPDGERNRGAYLFDILMISSILSPFWAVFVTRRKNMVNVIRYLLRFITVFEAATSDHKLFRKKLKLDWRHSFPTSKKAIDEGTCTGLILCGETETVKHLMADLLKVETIVHSGNEENCFPSYY